MENTTIVLEKIRIVAPLQAFPVTPPEEECWHHFRQSERHCGVSGIARGPSSVRVLWILGTIAGVGK